MTACLCIIRNRTHSTPPVYLPSKKNFVLISTLTMKKHQGDRMDISIFLSVHSSSTTTSCQFLYQAYHCCHEPACQVQFTYCYLRAMQRLLWCIFAKTAHAASSMESLLSRRGGSSINLGELVHHFCAQSLFWAAPVHPECWHRVQQCLLWLISIRSSAASWAVSQKASLRAPRSCCGVLKKLRRNSSEKIWRLKEKV